MSRPDYQSYLLRLWRDGANKPWHASLQSTTTERVHPFATFEEMLAFLVEQLTLGETGKIQPPHPASPEGRS